MPPRGPRRVFKSVSHNLEFATPMTQPPQFDYYQPAAAAYSDSLAPLRRAGIMLFVMGTLMAGVGLCNMVSTFTVSSQELQQAQARMMPKDQPPPFRMETIKTMAVAMQGAVVVVGLILLALGVPVRGGSFAATMGATIVTGLILALITLMALVLLVASIASPPLLIGLCFLVFPLVGFGVQLFWLYQAIRAVSLAKTAGQQYAAHYWQYYQQQQQAPQAGPYAPPGVPLP